MKTIYSSSHDYTYTPDLNEGLIPTINAKYEYIWDGDKVSKIIENLTIDNGVKYKGQSAMYLSYDANGDFVYAKCRGVPEIELTFRNGNI